MRPSIEDLTRETAEVLGMAPLSERTLSFGLQVLCQPSFHPECGFTVTSDSNGALLEVHSALRSIWCYLGVKYGRPSFGGHDWISPPIAREPLRLSPEDLSTLVDASSPLTEPMPEWNSVGLDGMPVSVEVISPRLGRRTFELWFSEDADTPPGRLVLRLFELAQRRCSWEATRTALRGLDSYSDR